MSKLKQIEMEKEKIKTQLIPPKVLLFMLLPIILLLELLSINWITDLMRQPSDTAVLMGVISITLLLIGNYILFKFIYKLFNKN